MTDWKTMRVPAEAWERANEAKRDEETWGDFLQRCSNEPPAIREFVDAGELPDMAGVQSSLAIIEERTGRIAKQLDDLEALR
jgi:hypothetical protein